MTQSQPGATRFSEVGQKRVTMLHPHRRRCLRRATPTLNRKSSELVK
ncbi:MAG: hypothetical protein V7K26_31690 [Nostoc sp.]